MSQPIFIFLRMLLSETEAQICKCKICSVTVYGEILSPRRSGELFQKGEILSLDQVEQYGLERWRRLKKAAKKSINKS